MPQTKWLGLCLVDTIVYFVLFACKQWWQPNTRKVRVKSYMLQCLCANFRNISIMQCVNPMVSLVHKYGAIVKQEEVSVCQSHLVFLCLCCVDFIIILWANTLLNASVTAKTVISVFFQLLLNFAVEFVLLYLTEMMNYKILLFEDIYLITVICACLGNHQLILLRWWVK